MDKLGLGKKITLEESQKRAKHKIEQILSPLWDAQEIPRFFDADCFNSLAEKLWQRTGTYHLDDFLKSEDSYTTWWEVDRLETIPEFVINTYDNHWNDFDPPRGYRWNRGQIAFRQISESISGATKSSLSDVSALWSLFADSDRKKLSDYFNSLLIGMGIDEKSWFLGEDRLSIESLEAWHRNNIDFGLWERFASYVLLYASSYISRLVVVYHSLTRTLTFCAPASYAWSLFSSQPANSYQLSPQVLKRPPPPSVQY